MSFASPVIATLSVSSGGMLECLEEQQPEGASPVPRISIDIDGVLANRMQALLDLEFVNSTNYIGTFQSATCSGNHPDGPCHSCLCVDPAFQRELFPGQLGLKRFYSLLQTALATPDFYADLPVFMGEESDIEKLQDYMLCGQVLVSFISTRCHLHLNGPRSDARTQTIEWLDMHGFRSYVEVNVMSHNKLQDIINSKISYHLDDDPNLVRALRAAGIDAFLLQRPWNVNAFPVDSYFCVTSIGSFLDYVAPSFYVPWAEDT